MNEAQGRPLICFLFSRCRTGSTTITTTFDAHAEVVAFTEIFNGRQPHSYQAFIADRISIDPGARASFLFQGPLFAFEDYIEHLARDAVDRNQMVRLLFLECKMENLWVLSGQWTHPTMHLENNLILRLALGCSDVVFFLRRINLLSRFCSDYVAAQTGVFHAVDGSQESVTLEKPIAKVAIRPEKFVENLLAEIRFDQEFASFVGLTHSNYHLLEYEKIFANGGFSREFLDRIERIFPGIRLPEPVMGKVRSLLERDIIDNYHDVETAIRNVPLLTHILSV